jgi:NDP-sugar pyrophosphorylase family protein
MSEQFRVELDNAGRINHFRPVRFSDDEPLSPEAIGEYLDGDERVTLKGIEYVLTQRGNLIHPEVDVIPSVSLGFGVRLDKDVTFHAPNDALPEPANCIVIQDRTRIVGTDIGDGVVIAKHALIRASQLGTGTQVGNHTRLDINVVTQPRSRIEDEVKAVLIGDSVRIGEGSSLGAGAIIKDGAHLGPGTIVWPNEPVGRNARIGVSSGSDYNGINKAGVLVYNGKASQDNAVMQ